MVFSEIFLFVQLARIEEKFPLTTIKLFFTFWFLKSLVLRTEEVESAKSSITDLAAKQGKPAHFLGQKRHLC